MIPIDGIMVPGMCSPLRPKALKCPEVDATVAAMNRHDGVFAASHTPEAGLTAENGAQLAFLPDSNSIEVYKKGNSTISIKIDPIIKKDFRIEWTYKLSEVDVNAGYEDASFDVA